jgi:hypothetical protein
VEEVGKPEKPIPSLKRYQYFKKLPKAAQKSPNAAILVPHYDSIRFGHQHFDDLMEYNTYEEICAICEKSYSHEAFKKPWTHFLGHIAAMHHIHKLGAEGRSITGLAHAYSCEVEELQDDVERMTKRDYDDPVSHYCRFHFAAQVHPAQPFAPRTPAPVTAPRRPLLTANQRASIIQRLRNKPANKDVVPCAFCLEGNNPRAAFSHITANCDPARRY